MDKLNAKQLAMENASTDSSGVTNARLDKEKSSKVTEPSDTKFALGVFSSIAILSGVSGLIDGTLFVDRLLGITRIVFGVLILPGTTAWLRGDDCRAYRVPYHTFMCFFLIVAFGIGSLSAEERQRLEMEAAESAAHESFVRNRESIVAEVDAAVESQNYTEAIRTASKYVNYHDDELNSLLEVAKTKQSELERKKNAELILSEKARVEALLNEREYKKAWDIASFYARQDPGMAKLSSIAKTKYGSELYAAAKRIPASDVRANVKAYEELSRMFPENKVYRRKYDDYLQKSRKSRFVSSSGKISNGVVLGRWKYDYLNDYRLISLVRKGGKTYRVEQFDDGSELVSEVSVRPVNGKTRYRKLINHNGDYVIIKPNGDLGHYIDGEGWWYDSLRVE